MKYFKTYDEIDSTGYIEFRKGEWDETFWKYDSLYLDPCASFDFFRAFYDCVEGFSEYTFLEITAEQWDNVKETIRNTYPGGVECMEELAAWLEPSVYEMGRFSFLGV